MGRDDLGRELGVAAVGLGVRDLHMGDPEGAHARTSLDDGFGGLDGGSAFWALAAPP
jgi:hypothetical protein